MSMMPNFVAWQLPSYLEFCIVSLCLVEYVMETQDPNWGGLWQKGFGFIVTLEVNFGCGQLCFFLIEETCDLLSYWTSQQHKLLILNSGSPAQISYAKKSNPVVHSCDRSACANRIVYSVIHSYICFSSHLHYCLEVLFLLQHQFYVEDLIVLKHILMFYCSITICVFYIFYLFLGFLN